MGGKHKIRIGHVISDKMNKTVVVAVETQRQHLLYKKTLRYRVKFKAHDENNTCRVGDVVRIVETRPLSKDKRWRVVEIVSRAEAAEAQLSENRDDSNLHQA